MEWRANFSRACFQLYLHHFASLNCLLHSAMGRLGVHKSCMVDVTTHFGSSTPSQNCCDYFFPSHLEKLFQPAGWRKIRHK